MTSSQIKKNLFSSRLGFIAVASGAAIGLGNIWRFPYLVGRYGGASFVLLYLLSVFLLGYPIMVAKIALGRATRGGTYRAYQLLGGGKWLVPGLFSTGSALLILAFYPVVMGWLIGYFRYYLDGSLLLAAATDGFFDQFVQKFPEQLLYTSLAWLAMLAVVGAGMKKGVERFAKVAMPFFYLLLVGLFLVAIFLSGSQKGLAFYLIPNFEALSWEALFAALGQAFASLAIGNGISITFGTHVSDREDLLTAGVEIVMKDTLVACFSGMIIFPIIFHADIDPSSGPSLIFCSLPLAFQSIGGVLGRGLGLLFFFLLFIAALTSAIALLEVPVRYFMERLAIKRRQAILTSSLIAFGLGFCNLLGLKGNNFFSHLISYGGEKKDFFYLLDLVGVELLMPLAALLFCLFISYGWGIDNLMRSLKKDHTYLKNYFLFTLNYLGPVVILVLWLLKLSILLRG